LNPFSSTFRAFIQHPDELASGYVLVVPPGQKTKNHRKNTGVKCSLPTNNFEIKDGFCLFINIRSHK
jgi:hypothetical protein